MKALLMLENGMTFEGTGFGYEHDVLCEVVFNSAMCGYTELLTDPSYAGQGVVMTFPLIGNYGICYDDAESTKPWLGAFIVRSVSGIPSNFRCDVDLDTYLKQNKVPGMYGIDTRALTRVLRESGTMRGMISYGEAIDPAAMKKQIEDFVLKSYVPTVSDREGKVYGDGPIRVALADYGVKHNIIRCLVKRGCTVKCFPYDASMEDFLAFSPDGIMLSNGPGDPQACVKSIQELKRLYDHGLPIFGICLGHQLMALAQGFGRIGCFLAGCCYGKETESVFSVIFQNSEYAPNHVALIPTQLYSSGLDFLHFLLLLLIARNKKEDGQVTACYLIFYSIGRFVIEFFRGDIIRGSVGILSTSQFISIFTGIAGIVLLIRIRKKRDSKSSV